MQSDHRAMRALWPVLLLAVLAYVVADFVQSPFGNVFSDAIAAPEPHLTLWLAQTETSASTGATARLAAGDLILHGRSTGVGVIPGGASRAITQFLSRPQSPGQLLVVSSDTIADLAQERTSALVGEEPLRAAMAERLLAEAAPIAVLSEDPLTIAVPPGSPLKDVAELMADMRLSPDAHVFAATEDNWAADNLAALVQQADVEGVVRYRVFPTTEDVSLALAAGSAEVVLAPRSAILGDLRAHRLRALAWSHGARPSPSWVELVAPPGTAPTQVATLRREVGMLAHGAHWRMQLRSSGQEPSTALSGAALQRFLTAQSTEVRSLQQIALQVERP